MGKGLVFVALFLSKRIYEDLKMSNFPYGFLFRYNALDAIRLISFEDDGFHCESCNTELVAESDKLASQDIGDGDDNARRRRREKLRDLLQKLEVPLFLLP